jgi:hypothetical protein
MCYYSAPIRNQKKEKNLREGTYDRMALPTPTHGTG